MSRESAPHVDPDLSASIEKADVFALAKAAPSAPTYPLFEERVITPKPPSIPEIRNRKPLVEEENLEEAEEEKQPPKRGWLYIVAGLIVILLGVGFWFALPVVLQKISPGNKEVALVQPNPPAQDKNNGAVQNNPPIAQQPGKVNFPAVAAAGQPDEKAEAPKANGPKQAKEVPLNRGRQPHGGARAAPNLPEEQVESRPVKAVFVQLPKTNELKEPTDYSREVTIARELPISGNSINSFIDKATIAVQGFEKQFKIEWDTDALIFERLTASGKSQPIGKLVLTGKSLRFTPLAKQVSSDDVEALLQGLAVKVSDDNDVTDVLFFVRDNPGADFEKGTVVDELKEKMTLKTIDRPNDPATFASGTLHSIPSKSTITYLSAHAALATEIRKMLTYFARSDDDKVRLLNGSGQPCNDDFYALQLTSGDFLRPDKVRIKYAITCNETKIKECLELKKLAQKDDAQQAKADELEESLKNELPTKVEFLRIVVVGKIQDTEFEIWRMDAKQPDKVRAKAGSLQSQKGIAH
jgi:hypothetical protein